MNDNNKTQNINSEEYWENRFSTGDWEEKQGREQSLFFYNVAAQNFPDWFKEDVKKNKLSFCDLGCAEGEGVSLLGDLFEDSSITGCDISEEALKKAKKYYPKHNFMKEDINNFNSEYDIIFTSNTFEHFENADVLMKKTIKNCKKYFVAFLPFQEFDRIDEHFFTFDYDSFSVLKEDFTLVFFKIIDCRTMEKTQWPGDEILVIYQKNNTEGIEERTLAEIGLGIDEGREKYIGEKKELLNEIAELKEKLEAKNNETEFLKEKIEEDRNAIMQIQFEASQHKQTALDERETYVWKTGLKIEKLLQKTGFAFIRSLLVLSDYKRVGFFIALQKGLNEALHRENVELKKKRKLELCGAKFLKYKKSRNSIIKSDITKMEVPFEKGLVSVVLPVFNGENVIAQSLESVIKQSYKDIEIIIVNDGSVDDTERIIREFEKKDKRIKVISQENKKLPTALSVGFREAKGEFLTWTSADNIMLENCIEILVENLKRKKDVSMVYGNMRLIDKRGKIKRGHFWFEKPFFSGNVCFPRTTEKINTYANNTIGAAFMYRASAAYLLEDYSKYKTNLEDYDYWMRMNSLLKIEHIDEEKPIYLYRIHDESLTAHDKELGITKNRYKLMVLDDFRRDFYMSSLVWIIETEDESRRDYLDFKEKAIEAGHVVFTEEEVNICEVTDIYSCVCYIFFGNNPSKEKLERMKRFSGSVLVADSQNVENTDAFDLCISTKNEEKIERLSDYKGWFYAEDGTDIFDIADTKLKNKLLYSLEKMIDEPEECTKKISIIICTYLRGEKLIDAIWSVIRQSMSKKEYEIIIVDNAPLTSGIREQVNYFQNKYKEIDGYIRYIGVPQKGLSYARNAGMWNAKGEYLLFLDDDVLADYYLLEEIYSAFKYHPNVGIVGGQVILDVPFPKPDVVRKGWESLWSQFKISENTFREVTQQFEFPYGADYAVRRQAIWRVGGFRMCYGRVGNDFAGGEETALAFKMLQIGYGVGLQPGAKVLHRVDHSRFNMEHVRKTILAGTLTTYRFFCDLHTPYGWTEKYVKNQIKITKKEIKRFEQRKEDYLDIFYKKCYLEAWQKLLEYMKEK